MGIIDEIRIRSGKISLRRELNNQRSRKVVATKLNDATSVALLLKIKDEKDYKKVTKFMKYLKEEFGIKRVFFLGYWDDAKNDPDFLQSKLDFDFFVFFALLVQLVISIWIIVIYVNALAEVQKFSILSAIFNIILSYRFYQN